MPFSDLLRVTVLLTAGEATALGMITVIAAQRDADDLTLIVAAVWWALAIVAGLWLGRGDRPAAGVRPVLTEAQMATSLPEESPTRIALQRLWPIAATALIAAGLGIRFPGVAAIGTGFALLIAVAWRGRESAVEAIEQRDGARFYVLPGSAFKPLKLMRSPGLHRGRPPHPKPPPPPPATS